MASVFVEMDELNNLKFEGVKSLSTKSSRAHGMYNHGKADQESSYSSLLLTHLKVYDMPRIIATLWREFDLREC